MIFFLSQFFLKHEIRIVYRIFHLIVGRTLQILLMFKNKFRIIRIIRNIVRNNRKFKVIYFLLVFPLPNRKIKFNLKDGLLIWVNIQRNIFELAVFLKTMSLIPNSNLTIK